jgi:hypothetical protein
MSFLNQVANSFDPTTVKKVQRSALLALSGFAVAVIPMLLPDIMRMAQGHPVIVALVSSGIPWVVNLINQWRAGQPQP